MCTIHVTGYDQLAAWRHGSSLWNKLASLPYLLRLPLKCCAQPLCIASILGDRKAYLCPWGKLGKRDKSVEDGLSASQHTGYTQTWVRARMHTCTYLGTCTHIHPYACEFWIHAYVHTRTHPCMHACMHETDCPVALLTLYTFVIIVIYIYIYNNYNLTIIHTYIYDNYIIITAGLSNSNLTLYIHITIM